jgi:PII-like signaling protein
VIQVTMVRIYITERAKLRKPITRYLHDEAKVRGISVFRAVSGFGESGTHQSSFVDLSLDLPLTIEFFDHPDKVKLSLEKLSTMVKPEHLVFWDAWANDII